jgi:hypothetical protein
MRGLENREGVALIKDEFILRRARAVALAAGIPLCPPDPRGMTDVDLMEAVVEKIKAAKQDMKRALEANRAFHAQLVGLPHEDVVLGRGRPVRVRVYYVPGLRVVDEVRDDASASMVRGVWGCFDNTGLSRHDLAVVYSETYSAANHKVRFNEAFIQRLSPSAALLHEILPGVPFAEGATVRDVTGYFDRARHVAGMDAHALINGWLGMSARERKAIVLTRAEENERVTRLRIQKAQKAKEEG